MDLSNEALFERTKSGDTRAVARLISLIENRVPRARAVLSKLYLEAGKAHVIGVTGSPGAGKSTLVDHLALECHRRGKRVAVLAIDPTSPFSGGAVLGDRIRMSKVAEHPEVYIRSMATRGALGGTARATADTVRILDAAGFDFIFIETVGVGQAEVDIVKTAHTCLVVLVPGMGDGVQAIKAGILEIADLFIINKADREGADLLHKDLRLLLSLGEHSSNSWMPPIIQTVALTGAGIVESVAKIEEHKQWLATSGEGRERALRVLRESILSLVASVMTERVEQNAATELKQGVQACLERRADPLSVVEDLIRRVKVP